MKDEPEKKIKRSIDKGDIYRLSKPRITPLKVPEMDDNTIKLLKPVEIAGSSRYFNIFATLVKHPKLYKAWISFANYILRRSTLPAREREILILRIGWLCKSEYEWGQHVIIGKRAGLNNDEIKKIIEGPNSEGWTSFESALLIAVDELYKNSFISDNTWNILTQKYDEHQMMDLIFTVGQYQLVSMTLNSLGIQLDKGIKGFPK